LARAEGSGSQLVHVLRGVDEEDVAIGRRLGLEEVARIRNPARDQAIADVTILHSRKNMGPDGEMVGVAVNELEREHCVDLMIPLTLVIVSGSRDPFREAGRTRASAPTQT